jgi:bifunctional DNA-binding transcriptional regulator/antitoxin component of YhaV-PrlF toxin-antitoxin module
MKATGIVRTVDELGRIVLPIELRRPWASRIKTR